MILKKLSLLNYKNIAQAEIQFSPKINCFFGNNGMGKTNFLDAIYYLSFCKSHLNTPDSQILRKGEEMCILQGLYDYKNQEEEIFCAIKLNHKKIFKRNKKEYSKLSEHIGLLPVVIISPADSDLINGGSEARRRFMDLILSQQDKNYLHALIQYNKAMAQRNILLKNQSRDNSIYEVLELQMDRYGQIIYEKRKTLIREFIPLFNEFHESICSSGETVGLKYLSQIYESPLYEQLQANRERDIVMGYSSKGIHKDDLEMTLDQSLIRRIGSQGQTKTFMIALKLAQFILLAKKGDTRPILLLDDIFDKLDAERVEQIINIVSKDCFGQIFVTDTNRKYLDAILKKIDNQYTIFKVSQGEIQTLEDRK